MAKQVRCIAQIVFAALLSNVPSSLAQDATAITYNPLGVTPVLPNTINVADRLYPYGFALDYCQSVGGTTDNSVCLQNALNATGVNFQSLEIQPPLYSVSGTANVVSPGTTLCLGGPTCAAGTGFQNLTVGDVICLGSTTYVNCGGATGNYRTVTFIDPSNTANLQFTPSFPTGSTSWSFEGVSTQINYYCSPTSLSNPLMWNATASGRVHIWKGANLSCALPPPDSMHVIVDDNVQPINPFAATSLPSGATISNFADINGVLNLSSPLSLSRGGTGSNILGTSGGIPYFPSTTTMASSGLLTANMLITGGGSGAPPAPGTISDTGTAYVFAPNAVTSGTQTLFTLTGPTSSLGNGFFQDVNFNLARTVTFTGGGSAFGAFGLHVSSSTYTAGLTQTLSAPSTLVVGGPPTCSGSTLTCASPRGLWVESSSVRSASSTVNNAFAAQFDAPTGATLNNWGLYANGSSCLGTSCNSGFVSTSNSSTAVVFNGTSSGSTTLTVMSGSGQTGNLLAVADNTGTPQLAVDANFNLNFLDTTTGQAQQINNHSGKIAGTVTIATGHTASATFPTPSYTAAPLCVVTPTSDPGTRWSVSSTATQITVNTPSNVSASTTFNYICLGNPN